MIRTAIQKDVVTLAGAARSPAVLSQVGGDVAFPDDVKSAIDTIGASADGKTLDQLVDLIELMWADPAVRRVRTIWGGGGDGGRARLSHRRCTT